MPMDVSSPSTVVGASLGSPPYAAWTPTAVVGETVGDAFATTYVLADVPGPTPATPSPYAAFHEPGCVALLADKVLVGWVDPERSPPREYRPRSAGLVVSETRLPAVVWNNTTGVATVSSAVVQNQADAGVSVDGAEAATTVPALGFVEFDVVVEIGSPTLPDSIDSDIDFTFDTGALARLEITGLRGLMLSRRPRPGGYAERLLFSTEIMTADDDTEWRSALLDDPVIGIDWAADAITVAEMQRMISAQRLGLERPVLVPRWFHATRLSEDSDGSTTLVVEGTALFDFEVGGRIAIVSAEDDSVASSREIVSLGATTIVVDAPVSGYVDGDFVVPCIEAIPDGGGLVSWAFGDRGEGRIRFEQL